MQDEVTAYEDQLQQVRDAINAPESSADDVEELKIVEKELADSIAELRESSPKYAVGDVVSTKKDGVGKVVEISKSRQYTIQSYAGEKITANEQELRPARPPDQKPEKPVPKADKESQVEKSLKKSIAVKVDVNKAPLAAPNDEFERGKTKWQQFSKSGRVSKSRSGKSKK